MYCLGEGEANIGNQPSSPDHGFDVDAAESASSEVWLIALPKSALLSINGASVMKKRADNHTAHLDQAPRASSSSTIIQRKWP
jgi:hypothetical protein